MIKSKLSSHKQTIENPTPRENMCFKKIFEPKFLRPYVSSFYEIVRTYSSTHPSSHVASFISD